MNDQDIKNNPEFNTLVKQAVYHSLEKDSQELIGYEKFAALLDKIAEDQPGIWDNIKNFFLKIWNWLQGKGFKIDLKDVPGALNSMSPEDKRRVISQAITMAPTNTPEALKEQANAKLVDMKENMRIGLDPYDIHNPISAMADVRDKQLGSNPTTQDKIDVFQALNPVNAMGIPRNAPKLMPPTPPIPTSSIRPNYSANKGNWRPL